MPGKSAKPFSEELLKVLAQKRVDGCHGATFGFVLGHLVDHGLTDTEIHLFAEQILSQIRELQNDPDRRAALETALRAATTP